MVAHRVVSPMLLGVKDNTGFGSNADELKTASILMDNMVIRPFQTLLINAFDRILAYNDISLHLYFKTLQPLEFTDLTNVVDAETREEETGVKLKKINEEKVKEKIIESTELDKFIELGENEDDILKEYDLIDEHEVDYDLDDELNENIEQLNNEVKLARVGKATPYKESEQDGKSKKKDDVTYLVRYMYTKAPGKADSSREFCVKMMRAKKGYRKEDIIAMSDQAVNPGFGKGGAATYSIWLWKGGARCFHRWTRKIYARKDGKRGLGDTVSTNKAISEGFKPKTNAKKVAIAPRNMEYEGYTAAYWNKMGFTYDNLKR